MGWIVRALLVALAAALVFGLSAPVPAARAEDKVEILDSLSAARQLGAQQRKPVLCIFVRKGHTASAAFVRRMKANKSLRPLLVQFAIAEVRPSDHADLVKRHNIQASPALFFMTPGGRPMKLAVGALSTGKLRGALKDVLAKWEELLDPWSYVPKQRKRSPSPDLPEHRRVHPSTCPHTCNHCDPAVEKALAWLVKRQTRDGSWTKLASEKVTKNEQGQIVTRNIDHIEVTLTSMAGLALLADGSTRREGPHAKAVDRAVRYLHRAVRSDGIVNANTGNDWLHHSLSIFESSLAALFLAEVHATQKDGEIEKDLWAIAAGLAKAQDKRRGGWGYGHDAVEHPGSTKRGWRLLATTHVALSALNAIRDAGVPVPEDVFPRGAQYLRSCVGKDGTFQYRTELRMTKGYPGATSGALFAISRSGNGHAGELAGWRARHRRDYRAIEGFGEHWWWMAFFGALAANDTGQGTWEEFHGYFRDVVLHNQKEDGSWDDPDEKAGDVFATAIGAFVLRFGREKLPLLGRRTGETDVELVRTPSYLTMPDPTSRVKVFEHGGRYLADLIVSTDGEADAAWFENVAEGLRGANRLLFDVTDGALSLHRIRIVGGGKEWDTADIRITKDFYSDPNVPKGGAHGITLVSKRTDIRNGKETERPRIGQWVKLPYTLRGGQVTPWQNRGLQRVMAHELAHYLLGIQDEYGVGGAYCACLVADPFTTELCREGSHTDDRREHACWDLARRLYPKWPRDGAVDPGPWDPPRPVIEIAAE